MNLMNLIIQITVLNWIIGAVILIYFALLDIWNKDFKMALATILFAAFPLTAIVLTVVCYAGLIRYFLFMRPKSFKQLIYDLKVELMFDILKKKNKSMKAIEFPEVNVRMAENQPEYETLPVNVSPDPETDGYFNQITMCFELTEEERKHQR